MELLLGCGHNRVKKLKATWLPEAWTQLVTLDIDPGCGASVLADFDTDPLPFRDDTFDEVHAYELLEHLGTQGDYRAFFRHFGEIYRVLKPRGILCGTTPKWDNRWAFGDPGHRRVISPDTLTFLAQPSYKECDDAVTSRTDYRWIWQGDLRLIWLLDHGDSHCWILQCVKDGGLTSPDTGDTPAKG